MSANTIALNGNGGVWFELKRSFTPNQAISRRTLGILVSFWIFCLLYIWIYAAPEIIPRPPEVFTNFLNLYQNEGLSFELWKSVKTNVQVIFCSTLLSLLISYSAAMPIMRPFAEAASKSRFLGLSGLLVIFMSVFTGGHGLKIALMTFGMSAFNISNMGGVLNNIPKEVKDHARTLRMGEWEVVWEVHIRGTLHKAFDVIRDNAAIGWMMLTMVEGLVRSGGGVGKLLLDENKHLNLGAVFAIQIVIITVGMIQDYGLGGLKNLVCPYAHLTLERR